FVHLQDEAGVGDGFVLLADRFRDGDHVRLFRGVELVAHTGTEAEWAQRRGVGLSIAVSDSRFQRSDVALDGALRRVADGSGADAFGVWEAGWPGWGEAGSDRPAG